MGSLLHARGAPRRRRHLGATACLLAALLPPPGAAAQPAPPEAGQQVAAERLVHLLQYIAVDYGRAVEDGSIANPFEYAEMRRFSQLLVDRSGELAAGGASAASLRGLVELREAICGLRSWAEVRERSEALAAALVRDLGLAAGPGRAPDLERGREVYAQRCAACHGAGGLGDGPAARGIDPPATSFADPRMDLLSLHHLYGTIRFGIDGTAMPAYADDLDEQTTWDVAGFVAMLGVRLARGRAAPAPRVEERSPPDTAPPRASGLELALGLQDTFGRVAERVSPSVVGVTGLMRRAGGAPSSKAGARGWREGSAEERLYPGFEPARFGSGFVVSESDHVVTAYHVLTNEAGAPVDAVDVELDDGRHRLARIVGLEPTIGLGVLQLEQIEGTSAAAVAPVRTGDPNDLRVGHWAIALWNPAGPGRTFAVGTLASLPERECYQQELASTLLQASLRVPAGALGGPLVNIEGEVIGMLVPGPGDDAAARSVELALPIELALAIYEPLAIKGSRRSPWLGFSVLERRAARRRAGERGEIKLAPMGIYIDGVFEPSPAAAADVRIGDWLLAIDGNRITSVGSFQRRLYLSGIGSTITLEILRDGEILEKRVAIEERPEAANPR